MNAGRWLNSLVLQVCLSSWDKVLEKMMSNTKSRGGSWHLKDRHSEQDTVIASRRMVDSPARFDRRQDTW